MTFASILGHALLIATCGYALLSLLACRWWQRRVQRQPGATQAVSVLKPLYGHEPGLYDNLRSFCLQDHPHYQLVFGLHSANDAALATVERLRAEFPQQDIAVVIDARVHGLNLKVSNLINLLPQARHDWLLLADSDIHAPPDLLRRITAPLADPTVGVVSCLYRGAALGGLWARLGAQFIDDWFAPSVTLARRFGYTDYSFGASIALRRDTLNTIGGFEALSQHVADDYWLGELTRRQGLRTVLSECSVQTDVIETRLADLAARELRWLRSIRSIAPLGYLFMFISFATPMAVAGWLMAGGTLLASLLASAALGLRLVLHSGQSKAPERTSKPLDSLKNFSLVPVRDCLSLLLWTIALAGRVVRWRGRQMKIARRIRRPARTPALQCPPAPSQRPSR
ncbi:bacteriohopanetetrol glucosamine biosynthesis glycosyltransferase HpnI [uncultured Nevskia sp.]|uniref:bacteriohopanetetrol glucosamine biosynthesis glycosyltransferase HpnI n=1 Tax=uncultured Nevskia sp. TaxID=228950 RepID=UPI0025EC89E2|nr:bacteriohopanetetrol glucosamine biosynthesis glycosyltransferase HpnI [uncultured Nevskia sp.]